MDDEVSIGENVRSIRLWRGKSLETVAGLCGHQKTWLNKIELGERSLNSRRSLALLAEALECSVADITRQPYLEADREVTPAAHAVIPKIREALYANQFGSPTISDARPIRIVLQGVQEVSTASQIRGDFATAGRLFPGLLGELNAIAARSAGPDRQEALGGIVKLCAANSTLLWALGYPDLRWVSAQTALHAAREASDPAIRGLGDFLAAQAAGASDGMDAKRRAIQIAQEGAVRLQGVGLDGSRAEIYGMLHLAVALDHSVLGEDPGTHLDEATEIGDRVGVGSNFGHLMFGQANVQFWRAAIALERGDPDSAVATEARVIEGTVSHRERMTTFRTDVGRALAQVKRTEDATKRLLAAERLSPQVFRNSPAARIAIGDLLHQKGSNGTQREVRGMAYRCGMAH